MARVLFMDLADRMAGTAHSVLRARLEGLGHHVVSGERVWLASFDVAFCDGDQPGYKRLIRDLLAMRPSLPVVVVTQQPDDRKWLDALEAGAADYCSVPFDAGQLRWIVDGLASRGLEKRVMAMAC